MKKGFSSFLFLFFFFLSPGNRQVFISTGYLASQHSTYHCVHTLKSIPVRALQQRIAVFISTEGSFSGSGPSSDGDQCPPIAIASSLPFIPTKN